MIVRRRWIERLLCLCILRTKVSGLCEVCRLRAHVLAHRLMCFRSLTCSVEIALASCRSPRARLGALGTASNVWRSTGTTHLGIGRLEFVHWLIRSLCFSRVRSHTWCTRMPSKRGRVQSRVLRWYVRMGLVRTHGPVWCVCTSWVCRSCRMIPPDLLMPIVILSRCLRV